MRCWVDTHSKKFSKKKVSKLPLSKTPTDKERKEQTNLRVETRQIFLCRQNQVQVKQRSPPSSPLFQSMGLSLAVVVVTASLHLIAFVLAIGAERRRSTGKVVPDEYDERTFCVYDSDASTVYGLSAFTALFVSQAVISFVTKCLCLGHGLAGHRVGSRACTVVSFAVSWLCFLVAEACLIAGSARNAYHTKYIGYYEKKDLTSCIALRKGVFAAAAAFVLISLASSLSFYWSYAKADPVGWVKHQNEGGVGMAEYGQDKGEVRSSNI